MYFDRKWYSARLRSLVSPQARFLSSLQPDWGVFSLSQLILLLCSPVWVWANFPVTAHRSDCRLFSCYCSPVCVGDIFLLLLTNLIVGYCSCYCSPVCLWDIFPVTAHQSDGGILFRLLWSHSWLWNTVPVTVITNLTGIFLFLLLLTSLIMEYIPMFLRNLWHGAAFGIA